MHKRLYVILVNGPVTTTRYVVSFHGVVLSTATIAAMSYLCVCVPSLMINELGQQKVFHSIVHRQQRYFFHSSFFVQYLISSEGKLEHNYSTITNAVAH